MDVRPWLELLNDLLPIGETVEIIATDRLRMLSCGEVKLPSTFNHKTGAPEPGGPGEEHYYDIAVRQMRQNGAPDAVWEATGIWATPRGHGYMGDYHDDKRLVAGSGHLPSLERPDRFEPRRCTWRQLPATC